MIVRWTSINSQMCTCWNDFSFEDDSRRAVSGHARSVDIRRAHTHTHTAKLARKVLKEISKISSSDGTESTKGRQGGLRISLNEFRNDDVDNRTSATRCMIVLLQCAFERDEPDDVVCVESFCHEFMESLMPFPVGAVWCQLYMTKNKHDVPLASLSESLGFYQSGTELRVESKIASEIKSNEKKRMRYLALLRLFVRSLRHVGKIREAELAIRSAPLTDRERDDVSKCTTTTDHSVTTATEKKNNNNIKHETSEKEEVENESSNKAVVSSSSQDIMTRIVNQTRNTFKYITNRIRALIESESQELRNSSGRLVQLFWFLVLLWLLSSQRRQIRLVLGRIFGSLRDDFSAVLQ